jgi:Cu+-exporting ATPase
MSGIVFFMLVGRVLQERTQSSISFHRNYTSYFPISVTIITDTETSTKEVSALNTGDCILLHAEEIVPADCIVKKGTAYIDYSFVSGESSPVRIKEKEIVYAGGKQINETVVLEVVKPIEQSYLTSLWNHFSFSKNKEEENKKNSFIPILSNYFSSILFAIAIITALYWYFVNPSLILPSVSAVLIVACPCALLLTSTFTNGIMMKLLSDHGLYLRDASVIEQLSKTNHIVFDKTGTLTHGHYLELNSNFTTLNKDQKHWIYNVAQASQHPMAKALCTYLGKQEVTPISHWTEDIGAGIMATVAGKIIQIGSREFTSAKQTEKTGNLWISIDGVIVAVFESKSQLRSSLPQLFNRLKKRFQFSLLSGDTEKDKTLMQRVFPKEAVLQFGQKPLDKLHFIESLQTKGKKVLMIGDGLNDAGALQQSNVGITLSENINNFSPSCDAILDAKQFGQLPNLIKLATFSNTIIAITFFVSILYNIIGIGYCVQGKLNPMIAAILMPTSTISIILLTTGLSYWGAKRFLK